MDKVEEYRSEFHLVSPSGKARLGTQLGGAAAHRGVRVAQYLIWS